MKLVITKELERKLKKIGNNTVAQYLLSEPEVDEINYLGIAKKDPSQISFIFRSKLNYVGFGKRWRHNLRQCTKPGRLVLKLNPYFTGHEIETFSNNYLATHLPSKFNIKIVHGEDIRFYYHVNQYYVNDGDLGCSCMKHERCQPYFDIYVKNPDHVGMAVYLTTNNKILGRALVWYPDTKKGKTVYFDRIYAISREVELQMYNWFIKKGFIGISSKNINKPESSFSIRIELPNTEFKYYPYVDTLSYLEDGALNNMGDGIELCTTDGLITDSCCDECGSEGELFEVDGRFLCEDCCKWSDHHRCYIESSECGWCDFSEDYFYNYELVELYNGKECFSGYYELEGAESGEWFILGDENFIQPIGYDEWYKKDSSDVELVEGNYYVINSNEYNELNIVQ